MTGTQMNVLPTSIQVTPTRRRQRGAPFTSERSPIWYDQDDSTSGEDKEEGDGDTDSLASADSSDSIATPEASPPQHRHAVLQEDHFAPAIGAFDHNGDWTWSTKVSLDAVEGREDREALIGSVRTTASGSKPVLNRHDRSQIVMTGRVDKFASQRRASDMLWSDTGSLTHDILQADEDDSYDVVGFTSYQPLSAVTPRRLSEGHSVAMPVRIRLEEDSSSDESESSVVTNSSGGSDSEARRRASFNMLQRLGKTVTIPERRASALRLGQGAPRRPPSLDEISNRVVASGGSPYGRGTPPGSAVPHQRAVSCPSPLPLQWQRFGEVDVMITPPTPQMSAEKIPGVVIRSPHMPHCTFSTDHLGKLIAPAFDVAPGRQIMLEERERQAKQWLENFKGQQQQTRPGLNIKLGAGPIAPPIAHGVQAAAIITPPSSPTRSRSPSCNREGGVHTTMRQTPAGPPIPPRQRSFGRRIPAQTASNDCIGKIDGELSPADQAVTPVQVPERSRSPLNIPRIDREASAEVTTRRRSLVARLSLRRSSKELRDLQIPRKPVTTA